MKRARFTWVAAAAGAVVLVLDCLLSATAEAGPDKDIVDTAVEDGSFATLTQALVAAGLVDTLKGSGPYTVFAPSDEAFDRLPPGTLQTLLADKAKLTEVLTYHVVPGRLMAADAAKLSSAKTVLGRSVRITTLGEDVTIDNANVVKSDIAATNGVIHVIDAVILPH
jgi:uncharacterized surface protein with fasciclin (FAS1) repeats